MPHGCMILGVVSCYSLSLCVLPLPVSTVTLGSRLGDYSYPLTPHFSHWEHDPSFLEVLVDPLPSTSISSCTHRHSLELLTRQSPSLLTCRVPPRSTTWHLHLSLTAQRGSWETTPFTADLLHISGLHSSWSPFISLVSLLLFSPGASPFPTLHLVPEGNQYLSCCWFYASLGELITWSYLRCAIPSTWQSSPLSQSVPTLSK